MARGRKRLHLARRVRQRTDSATAGPHHVEMTGKLASATADARAPAVTPALSDTSAADLERAKATLDAIADGVISTDPAGRVTYLNAIAERMTGWSSGEARGRAAAEVCRIVDGGTRQTLPSPLELAVRENITVFLGKNAMLIRRDGFACVIEDSTAPIRDRHGRVAGAVMVFRDVSEARSMELSLSHLAHHDVLTGLPNRVLLSDRLSHAISLARRRGHHLAVLFMDVNGFKAVNDSLGHAVGDKLLQEVGRRLRASVRESDTVGRYGGDEFVVVLSEVDQAVNAARHAEKILEALSAPHAIEDHALHANVSIGISVFPDDGTDAETLVRCADAAMYRAKKSRRSHQYFRPAMNVPGVMQGTGGADPSSAAACSGRASS